jgi:hypothetical protein
MNELNTQEINAINGGVIANRWGGGCTRPDNGQEPKTGQPKGTELPLMPDAAL